MRENGWYGALIGDMVGSAYECSPRPEEPFPLWSPKSHPTDDSILTIATMDLIVWNAFKAPVCNHTQALSAPYRYWAKRYPNAGYGERFLLWRDSLNGEPSDSKGNGAAMRVSPIAYIARSEEEVLDLAATSAKLTHNTPEGIKGAQAIALLTYLALQGANKEELAKRACHFYPCVSQGYFRLAMRSQPSALAEDTVPLAIVSFLASSSFEDCLRHGVLAGPDRDTIAAMAGSIGGAYYGIDSALVQTAIAHFSDPEVTEVLKRFGALIASKQGL
jgi:ADP-ribosyl-[dinitrogen reductase] hydrolase